MRRITAGLLAASVLAGCGGGGDPLGTEVEGPAVAEVVEDVDYYYACGNETLVLPDGRMFYPLMEQDAVDQDDYLGAGDVERLDGVVLAAGLVLAVVAPGPGDDTGTLTVYTDGMAHFVSDSGIEAWLTEDEVLYEWVC